jgi:hypothetical protein
MTAEYKVIRAECYSLEECTVRSPKSFECYQFSIIIPIPIRDFRLPSQSR